MPPESVHAFTGTGDLPSFATRRTFRAHAQHTPRTDDVFLTLARESLEDTWNASGITHVKASMTALGVRSGNQRQTIQETILSFMSLKPGWGEPHYVPPKRRAIDDALRFLDRIPADCLLPHVSPAGDGEVNFCWRKSGLFIDVGFYGDGKICYYARVDSMGLDTHDEKDFSHDDIPKTLLSAMPTL